MKRRHIDARISGHVLALVRAAHKQRRKERMQEYVPNSATPVPAPVIQHVDYVDAGMDKEEVVLGEGDGAWAEAADAHRREAADEQAERSAPDRPEDPDADAILPDSDDPSRGGESGVLPGEDARYHIMDDNPEHGIIREPAPDTDTTKPAPEDGDPEGGEDGDDFKTSMPYRDNAGDGPQEDA